MGTHGYSLAELQEAALRELKRWHERQDGHIFTDIYGNQRYSLAAGSKGISLQGRGS